MPNITIRESDINSSAEMQYGPTPVRVDSPTQSTQAPFIFPGGVEDPPGMPCRSKLQGLGRRCARRVWVSTPRRSIKKCTFSVESLDFSGFLIHV